MQLVDDGALPPLDEHDARPDPPHAGVRAARARRHARPGVGAIRVLQRAARAPAAAPGAGGQLAVLVRRRTPGSRARASRSCAPTRAAGCRGVFATGTSSRARWRPRWARRATSTTTRSSGGTCARIRGSGPSRCARWTRSPSLDDAAALAALVHALAARALDVAAAARASAAEAIAESSFRASRDGVDATILHDGALRAAARGGARDGRVGAPAMPASSARDDALEGVERILREGGGAARQRAVVRGAAAWRRCSTQLVRETQGAPCPS